MQVFRSFDEAWREFQTAESLIPFSESTTVLSQGRAQAVAFTIPVEDPAIISRVEGVQDELATVSGLSLVPAEELHITLKLAGFQVLRRTMEDDLLREEVPRVDKQATEFFREVGQFTIRIGGTNAFPGCVILEIDDDGSLRRLNAALSEHIPLLHRYPADSLNYLPHLTIAVFEDGSGLHELRRSLPGLRVADHGSLTVRRIDFTRAWFLSDGRETENIKSYFLR